MKKKITYLAIVVLAGAGFLYAIYAKSSQQRDEVLLELMQFGLNEAHFSPRALDDSLSSQIFDYFVNELDPGKRIFQQKDVDQLEVYRHRLDDLIKAKQTAFFDKAIELFLLRISQIYEMYPSYLEKPIDFTVDEYYETDGNKRSYPASDDEWKDTWRQYLKYSTLVRLDTYLEEEKEEEYEVLEEKARDRTFKSMDDWKDRMEELDRSDWLNVFLNSILAVQDPHTNYMPPYDQEAFEIEMSGKLEGIGAQLSSRDGYITVVDIVSGSASWRQGELKIGDIILKVKQEEGDPVDITDMRIEEAVKLIRGPKGTKVTLTVKKDDGLIKDITLTRDVVVMEATYASSAVLGDENKYGYIKLPKFYLNYDGKGRDCAQDVRKEIEKLKESNVQGIVLDLRDNGGGSLQAAIEIAGLFIETGPVVQVKSRNRAPEILADREPSVAWDGPLIIMINAFSASASEILAAAMQDYGRALVIGSPHSFGKGTVQNIFELDRMVPRQLDSLKPLGAMKLTIQKFYRINGSTTQLIGVEPDVVWPSRYSLVAVGEKELDYPMGFDEIEPAKYGTFNEWKNIIKKVGQNASKRIETKENFQLVNEQAKFLKQRQDETAYSLNLEKYRAAMSHLEDESKRFDILDEYKSPLAVYMEGDVSQMDSVQVKTRERFIGDLESDYYLEESVYILSEMHNLWRPKK
jgi:carboxyl-terminal processing protease